MNSSQDQDRTAPGPQAPAVAVEDLNRSDEQGHYLGDFLSEQLLDCEIKHRNEPEAG